MKDPNQRANRETFPLQQEVNAKLIEYSQKFGIKLICSNDSHFVDEENAEAHDRLICLATGRDLDDPARMLYTKQEWFKTQKEMNEVFSDVPEALENTLEVLGKCEIYDIEHPPIMPFFAIPAEFGTEEEYRKRITPEDLYREFTTDENGENPLPKDEADSKIKKLGGIDKLYRIKFEADYLAKLAYDGAKKLYGDPLEKHVADQIKFELHIMKTMGFPGYFLIVQDFINAAFNELGVSVGPGRGSAAGSTVAYCLGITKIDPIKYDLLFERFLNPDRISLPDIDTDFDDDGRGELLRWVTEKYGAEKVAHIITYGAMATKSAIKDVARVQKLPLEISNKLCKLIPDKLPDGLKMNLPNAIKCIPELQQAETSPDDNLRDTIKYAKMLENNIRNTGVHACGTIICRDDISDWVPVSTAEDKETGEKLSCTQYDGHVIESTGLIKMDFLGLKTLSIIKEAIENIKYSLGVIVDETKFSLDDPATYKLYSDGRTIGTFQFESPGMQKYLRELQPSTFEDLIAMNALYRPGPMDYIPDFIDRKLGRKPVEYDIDCMQKYLKDTYGITVYQEQVMLLSRQLADFTRGESDALRKAMGKKKKDIVDKMKPKFIEGGKKNGHDPAILDKIWGDWEKFASYAFNKSHATCYSWVAYQTAYLKAHYPAQYMAAVMSRSLNSITDVTKLMDECRNMDIKTLGPDVNESGVKFSVNHKGDIRFGMGAVKGVGESAALAIILEREKDGSFKDIYNFVERVNLSACNRKAVENLAYAGAFDSFGIKREQFFAPNSKGELFIDCIIRYGNQYQTVKREATNSLFGGFDAVEIARPPMPNAEEWSALERLNREKDLVGVYLTAHPLDEYAVILNE
ncbi:MAG: DNA polymerase III subunit alpha, partial [Lachnospiraceae bacterium]|nr:DNA polymerase III subunit alpha [Lachnospiraceae bacterium]